MARPLLPIGTAGAVNTKRHPDRRGKQWQAYCAFRDIDGKTRQVERWGETEGKARRALSEAVRDRVPPSKSSLSAQSRFSDAAGLWFPGVEQNSAIRTVQAYRWVLNSHVLPALGDLRLGECTPARLNMYLADLAGRGYAPATIRNIKTVISGVFAEAVAHDVLSTNPARSTRPIKGSGTKRPRALTPDERGEFLARLDDLRCAHHLEDATRAARCKMCRAARGDVPDLARFMLGTGVRIGEALALRWCDVDLELDDTGWASGRVGPTLVRQPGNGLVRQGEGKTKAATRTILLPGFVVAMLKLRRPPAATDDDPVFPSTAHTWWDPASASKALRKARDRTGFDWVTSHVFRKTAATVLDDAGLSARQIADQLGHTRPSMTQDVYMGRGAPNPAAAAALDDAYRRRS